MLWICQSNYKVPDPWNSLWQIRWVSSGLRTMLLWEWCIKCVAGVYGMDMKYLWMGFASPTGE